MSTAVLVKDSVKVKGLLEKNPSAIGEINIYGQTPFHLAADNPEVLEILLKKNDISTLNNLDELENHAVTYAVALSGRHCLNGDSWVTCSECSCTDCFDMFLAHDVCFEVWSKFPSDTFLSNIGNASHACRLRLLREVTKRRELLKILGQEHLSPSEIQHCELDKSHMLDSFTNEVVRLLLGRKVSIPTTLQPRNCKYEDTPYWGSLYHAIGINSEGNAVKCAELLQQHGFTAIDSVDRFGITPLAAEALSNTCNSAYSLWLITHGADALKALPQYQENSSRRNLNSRITPAHMLLRPNIRCIRHGDHPHGDLEQYRHLVLAILPLRIIDGCCCGCTEKGCEPATGLVRGLWADWDVRYPKYAPSSSSIHKHAADISQIWHNILLDLVEWEHVYISALRLFTFEALGLRHTCCSMPCPPEHSAEEVQEIQNEESSTLELLESLVEEYTSKYKESGEEFTVFLSGYWAQRMGSVLADLEAIKLTQDELWAAEDVGIRWCVEKEEDSEGKDEDLTQLDYWIKRLDKITGE